MYLSSEEQGRIISVADISYIYTPRELLIMNLGWLALVAGALSWLTYKIYARK